MSSIDQAGRWKPSLRGRLLVWSLGSRRRFPTPRLWNPAADPRAGVVEAFLTGMGELRAMLDRTAGLRWTAIRFASPATALLRLNLGDAFRVLVLHAERHFTQIDHRLRRPAPAA
jgi:hypothetical protein